MGCISSIPVQVDQHQYIQLTTVRHLACKICNLPKPSTHFTPLNI